MSFFKKLFNINNLFAKTEENSIEQKIEKTASFKLSAKDILLNQTTNDKTTAIKLIAKRAFENGYTEIDFTEAMLARELHVSTYLINGIAIPHATLTAKKHIIKTGFIIGQFPEGIKWTEDGDIVYFAVGIIAKDDDHLAALGQLIEVVQDAALAKKLGSTASSEDIIQALSKSDTTSSIKPEEDKQEHVHANLDLAIVKSATITDKAGIHARPAAVIAKKAASFTNTKIQLRIGDKVADAKAIMKLLSLGAAHEQTIYVSAEGDQAQEAVDELATGFTKGWDS